MKLKILLSVLLTVLLLVPMTAGAGAESTGGAILVGSVTAQAGDNVVIPIDIISNPGFASMKLSVTYDSALTLTGIQDAGVLGDAVHSSDYTLNPYVLFWNNGTVTENFEVTGTIVNLYFTVDENVASGTYSVDVSYGVYGIVDVDMSEVPFTITNGGVTVVHVHDWDEPVYTWASDYSTCTAERVCKLDPSHIENETVTVTITNIPASCEENNKDVYTAVFDNPDFEEQTIVVVGTDPAIGHAWGNPTWTWASDYSSATATFVCANDAAHTLTVNAIVTYEDSDDRSTREYTATASDGTNEYTDIITVSNSSPTTNGHYVPTLPNPTLPNINIINALNQIRNNDSNKPTQPVEPSEPEKPAEEEPYFIYDSFPFVDVLPSSSYYDDVRYVYENDIMNGVSATEFAPNRTLTRAMIVTILYRVEGEPAVDFKGVFTDVPDDTWYSKAVEWAAANGIVNGYGDGKFGPTDAVTREQLAAILYRYAQFKGYDVSVGENTNILSYNDALTWSQWAVPALQWACGASVLDCRADGMLAPTADAYRYEVAAAIHAFCVNVVD